MNDTRRPAASGRKLMEPLVLIAVLAGWFVLQIWVLPKFGVRT